MISFTIAKCKTKAAYAAKLKRQGRLDLAKIKEKFEVILETPILLVVKIEEVEIVVHGYGELLFKNCEDVMLMKEIAEKIYQIGLRPR